MARAATGLIVGAWTPPTSRIPTPAAPKPLTLRRLLPRGAPASAERSWRASGWTDWRPPARPDRPHVMLNMVSTADGHATLGGRSGPISGPADRALFHGLRTGRRRGHGRGRHRARGALRAGSSPTRPAGSRGSSGACSEEPLACIVSGRLTLDAEIPLLADPAARVVILTPSSASLPAGAAAAEVDYIRAARDGQLDLPAALAELRERFDVRTLLCEGGPHLNAQLLGAGLVDELFLSLAPLLAGGEFRHAEREALRILAGARALAPGRARAAAACSSTTPSLFLRYSVRVAPQGGGA